MMDGPRVANLLADVPDALADEDHITLLSTDHLRLLRIVSTGQATPPGEWYDQAEAEWVMVLSGQAGLRFAGNEDVRTMRPGDYVLIPAHARHRVEWTSPDEPTVWLALHFDN